MPPNDPANGGAYGGSMAEAGGGENPRRSAFPPLKPLRGFSNGGNPPSPPPPAGRYGGKSMAEMAGENIPKCTAKDAKVRASVALAHAVAPAMREAARRERERA